MDTVLIATTRQEGLHAIGTAGQPVMQAYEQITRYLRQALTDDHAQLFAEPNPNPARGTVDWYAAVADSQAEVQRFDQADAQIQAEARETLDRLRSEIEHCATTLGESREGGERFLGRMLNLALEIPGEAFIYCVGSRPVLVCWGNLPDVANPERGVLRRMAPYRPPPMRAEAPMPATGQGATAMAGGVGVMGAATATSAGGRSWWLTALLWLLFLLLAVAVFIALLSGCGIGPTWLTQAGLFNLCPVPAVAESPDRRILEAEEIRHEILQEELARLRLSLAAAEQSCRRAAPLPAEEPTGLDEPEPEPEPEAPVNVPEPDPEPPAETPVAPLPDPPADPPAEPEEDTTEFDERLGREGGETGEVTVTLAWDSDTDLDLHIVCPNGQRINFNTPSGCGGQLDVDMNALGNDRLSWQPVENIVWANGAPPGRYQVRVDNYHSRSDGLRPVPFRLRVINGEATKVVEGSIREADGDPIIYQFTVQ